MYDAQQLDAVAARIKSYQGQIEALAHALDALRDLAGSLAQEMASESEAIGAWALAGRSGGELALSRAIPTGTDTPVDLPLSTLVDDKPTPATTETIERDEAANRLDGMEMVVSTADVPVPAATQAALDQVSKLVVKEKATESAAAVTADDAVDTKPAAARTRVLDFASRLQSAKAAPLRHKVAGAVASVMLMVSATAGVHGFLQTDIGQRLLELGSCDADAIQANNDCALLGWLLL